MNGSPRVDEAASPAGQPLTAAVARAAAHNFKQQQPAAAGVVLPCRVARVDWWQVGDPNGQPGVVRLLLVINKIGLTFQTHTGRASRPTRPATTAHQLAGRRPQPAAAQLPRWSGL